MSFELTDDEGKFLIVLAREAITSFLKTGKKITVPPTTSHQLKEKCGVFVTLNSVKRGVEELRGCIGYPEPIFPLVEATIDSAINSATQDPRFPPLTSRELDQVKIEVSILTPPKLMTVGAPQDYINELKIGRDGLIVERGFCKGLLLPQVPVEWQWNVEEFLSNCCMKASLPPDTWLIKGTRIYKFQAIIFKEKTPTGEIERVEFYEENQK
ncbi:MAG: uncharacterized protein QG670_1570 [Thermoproteota archaeon]|nr:uncharacterized protein [Thermoproteota archaeon]